MSIGLIEVLIGIVILIGGFAIGFIVGVRFGVFGALKVIEDFISKEEKRQ